jgi:hypothetical protein
VPGARKSYVQENATDLTHLAKLIDTDELRLRIADRFPLDDVRTAHERFEAEASSARFSSPSEVHRVLRRPIWNRPPPSERGRGRRHPLLPCRGCPRRDSDKRLTCPDSP